MYSISKPGKASVSIVPTNPMVASVLKTYEAVPMYPDEAEELAHNLLQAAEKVREINDS